MAAPHLIFYFGWLAITLAGGALLCFVWERLHAQRAGK
jgi:hypothetical protein